MGRRFKFEYFDMGSLSLCPTFTWNSDLFKSFISSVIVKKLHVFGTIMCGCLYNQLCQEFGQNQNLLTKNKKQAQKQT